MASFVREVLSATGHRGEKEDLAGKAARLRGRVDDFKAGLVNKISSRYECFDASFAEVSNTVAQLEAVVKEAEAFEAAVNKHLRPSVLEATRDAAEIVRNLQTLSDSVRSAKRIKNAYNEMERANELADTKHFLQSALILASLEKLLLQGSERPVLDKGHDDDETDDWRAAKAVRAELNRTLEKVGTALVQEWKLRISFDSSSPVKGVDNLQEQRSPSGSRGSVPCGGAVTCRLVVDCGSLQFEELVKAMQSIGILEYRLNELRTQIMGSFLLPIISGVPIETMDIVGLDSSETLSVKKSILIRFSGQTDGCGKVEITYPESSLSALERVFLFLKKAFSFASDKMMSVATSKAQESGCQFMGLLANDSMKRQFIDAFICKCLARAVPDSVEGLDSYKRLAQMAVFFAKDLAACGFLKKIGTDGPTAIEDYAANAETLFANKRCMIVLERARAIMKQDLLVCSKVDLHTNKLSKEQIVEALQARGIDYDEIARVVEDGDDGEDEDLSLLPLPEGGFAVHEDALFRFPACQVSLSVLQLVDLAESTLSEVSSSADSLPPFFSVRLMTTVRSMFEIYSDVLPIAHREVLANLPQASALAYNNCMYLAHQCMILGPAFSIGQGKGFKFGRGFVLADLVPTLRRTGTDLMLDQMKRQRDQMRSIIRDSSNGLGQLSGDTLLPPSAEKCLRQVVHLLKHLKNVWADVLPTNIYKKAAGTVLNSVVEDLVERVVALEDIATDSAEQICVLYKVIQDNANQVFLLGDEGVSSSRFDLVKHVKAWNRFKELLIVLNASMKEIEDRWASGKGALAAAFSVDEVKRLIRALFQNTDSRAAVLARIRPE